MALAKADILFTIVMSVVTTCMVTFVLCCVNLGFTERFLFVWLRSWGIAIVIACFSMFVIAPWVKKLFVGAKETGD